MQRERSNLFKDLQAMLQNMEEVMMQNHGKLKKEIREVRNDRGELKEKMQMMNGKFEAFQQQIMKNEQKLQEMEVRMEKEEKEWTKLTEKLIQANRKLENIVLFL